MDVSENSGTPKSSIIIGFSIINHPFLGTTIFGNTHMDPLLPRHAVYEEEKSERTKALLAPIAYLLA